MSADAQPFLVLNIDRVFTSNNTFTGNIRLHWEVDAGWATRLLMKESLSSSAWLLLTNVPARPTNGVVAVETSTTLSSERFYMIRYEDAEVYSVNVVGYANREIPANSRALLSVPFLGTNSDIGTVLSPTVPENTQVFLHRGTNQSQQNGWVVSTYARDDSGHLHWESSSGEFLDLWPGDGFIVRNPTASALALNFVGDVPQGFLSVAIPSGFSLKGYPVPASFDFSDMFSFPATDGDDLILRRTDWETNTYLDFGGFGQWFPAAPVLQPLEGFWIKTSTDKQWPVIFSVN
jgi:hypothetical protein